MGGLPSSLNFGDSLLATKALRDLVLLSKTVARVRPELILRRLLLVTGVGILRSVGILRTDGDWHFAHRTSTKSASKVMNCD